MTNQSCDKYVSSDKVVNSYRGAVECCLEKIREGGYGGISKDEWLDIKHKEAFGDDIGESLLFRLILSIVYFSRRGLPGELRQLIWEKEKGLSGHYKPFFVYCLFGFLDDSVRDSNNEIDYLFGILVESEFLDLVDKLKKHLDDAGVDLDIKEGEVYVVCSEKFLGVNKKELERLAKIFDEYPDADYSRLFFNMSDELFSIFKEMTRLRFSTPEGVDDFHMRGAPSTNKSDIKCLFSRELRGYIVSIARYHKCPTKGGYILWSRRSGFGKYRGRVEEHLGLVAYRAFPGLMNKFFLGLGEELYQKVLSGIDDTLLNLEVQGDKIYVSSKEGEV
ncbi:hypothetical protein ACFL2R_01885 [Patescibacteria group bacterium]